MAKGDDIRERLVNFAVMVIDLCEHLPKTAAAAHISMQLLRAATAAAHRTMPKPAGQKAHGDSSIS